MSTCVLMSSSGEVDFDLPSGAVISVDEDEESKRDKYLSGIELVDVKRLYELDPEIEGRGAIDILLVGYWRVDENGETQYVPPEPEVVAAAKELRYLEHVSTLQELALDPSSSSYNPDNKRKFETAAMAVGQSLADALQLHPDQYDLRYNAGGIAVSGEATLHADWVYIQFSIGFVGSRFLWRTCESQEDYTGDYNRYMPLDELRNLNHVARVIRAAKKS